MGDIKGGRRMKNITFKRQEHGDWYFYIDDVSTVKAVEEWNTVEDNVRFKTGNYYATEEYAEYRERVMRLQNNLERLCVKRENGKEDIKKLKQIYYNDFHDKVYFKDEIDVIDIDLVIGATDYQVNQCIDTFEKELKWYLTTKPPYLFKKDNSEEIKAIQKEKNKAMEQREEIEIKIIALNAEIKELENESK